MIEDFNDDAAFEAGLAARADPRWQEFFSWDVTRAGIDDHTPGFDDWYRLAYDLGAVQLYGWTEWCGGIGKALLDRRDLSRASVADAIRILTAIVRADRFSDGQLVAEMGHGLVAHCVRTIWDWFRTAEGSLPTAVDWSNYSDDRVYRWSFERRWGVGGTLCWIGLNPGTGDTDGKKRPTLDKVCRLAKSLDLEAVLVVNLFAFRSTDPKALKTAGVDVVGDLNDETIRRAVVRSAVTLAAWGADGKINARSRRVASTLDDAVCLGTTSSGEPRHPLYVPNATRLVAYRPLAD